MHKTLISAAKIDDFLDSMRAVHMSKDQRTYDEKMEDFKRLYEENLEGFKMRKISNLEGFNNTIKRIFF